VSKDLVSKPEYEEPLFTDFTLDKPVLNQTIAEHMYRSGFYSSGETFSIESNVTLDESFKEKFKVLNIILTDLRARSVKSALEWVKDNLEGLKRNGSDIQVSLHLGELSQIIREQVETIIERIQEGGQIPSS
jgi:hypothetical protein